jgi:hypothetical protein
MGRRAIGFPIGLNGGDLYPKIILGHRAPRLSARHIDSIVLTFGRSFKARIFFDRQGSMKDIAFDHSGTIQLDAICMDGPLDLSTNGQILGEYVAFYFRAFVYQNGQCPKLALDVPEDLYCAFAGNSSDDGHAATDRGSLVCRHLFPRVHRCRSLKLLHRGRHLIVLVLGLSEHFALLVPHVAVASRI